MFHNPADFQFTKCLTAHWQAIRDEYLALPQDAFDPWIQREMYG